MHMLFMLAQDAGAAAAEAASGFIPPAVQDTATLGLLVAALIYTLRAGGKYLDQKRIESAARMAEAEADPSATVIDLPQLSLDIHKQKLDMEDLARRVARLEGGNGNDGG